MHPVPDAAAEFGGDVDCGMKGRRIGSACRNDQGLDSMGGAISTARYSWLAIKNQMPSQHVAPGANTSEGVADSNGSGLIAIRPAQHIDIVIWSTQHEAAHQCILAT